MLHTLIATAETVAAIGFAILAARFYASGKTLGLEELKGLAVGFTLLASSQALMVVAVLAGDPRLAASSYIASTLQAVGGLAALTGRIDTGQGRALVLTPFMVKLAATILDTAAGITALLVSIGGRGPMRLGMAAIAFSYLMRSGIIALSGTLAPSMILELLLASEAVRAGSATLLAVYYAGRGGRGG